MQVAVYWDFENIHAVLTDDAYGEGAYRTNRFRRQERVVDIGVVTDYAAALGDIIIHRAYANWQWLGDYRQDTSNHGMDLIQLFPRGAAAKNGADIRIALDVLEDITRFPHITHVLIVSCDSDFIALSQKVRQAGKTIIGVGVDGYTNPYWVRSCNEFKYYGILLSQSDQGEAREQPEGEAAMRAATLADAKRLVVAAVRALRTRQNEHGEVVKAALRPILSRLDPTFDEANFGFTTFGEFLEACSDVVGVRPAAYDHMVRVREDHPAEPPPESPAAPAAPSDAAGPLGAYQRILRSQGVRLVAPELRRPILAAMAEVFRENANLFTGWDAVEEAVAKKLASGGKSADAADIHKVRGLAFKAVVFDLQPENQAISLKRIEDGAALNERVEKNLISRIVRVAPAPIDLSALCELLHGAPDRERESVERLARECAAEAAAASRAG